jgi:3-hydroxymyristoyl/3-hydroxydecanoyl-(acyl carrier protein) dehydratase
VTAAKRSGSTEPVIVAQQQDTSTARLELRVPKDLIYFRGHFPDQPVLPGIVQTHWAVACARRCFALGDAEIVGVQVKFKRVITPEMTLHLVLDYARDRRRVEFAYADAQSSFSSGVITFGAA